jgi:Mce-associated membrane protein
MTDNSATAVKPSPKPREETEEAKPVRRNPVAKLLRPTALAVAIGFVALAGLAVFFFVKWQQHSEVDEARAAALTAGKTYALDLSTYDYRKMDDNFKLVSRNASPNFAKQYKQVSDKLSGIIKQYQGVSRGTVVEAGVADADTSRVNVVMFVDQKITNTKTKDPRVDRSRMKMTLVDDNGAWKIDSLTLL